MDEELVEVEVVDVVEVDEVDEEVLSLPERESVR